MNRWGLGPNPDALSGAEPARTGHHHVNGTSIYAEVRGVGPVVLLISAVCEDAEVFRAVAERLTGFTVVTYDHRGTSRSGREDWPACGASQHAGDAAELLRVLDLHDVTVFGAGTGGIVGLELAIRNPELVRTALLYEPGYFGLTDDGRRLQDVVCRTVDNYLASSPEDWAGAAAVLGQASAECTEDASRGFFEPPPGKQWYTERRDLNAEAFVKNDIRLGAEMPDEDAVANCPVDLRIASGTAGHAVFHDVATVLASIRGTMLDVVPGSGHSFHYDPDAMANYIRERALHPATGH